MSRRSSRHTTRGRRLAPAILSRKRKLDATADDIHQTMLRLTLPTDDSSEMQENVPPTSDGMKTPGVNNQLWNRFRSLSCLPTPPSERVSPLPRLSWADPQEVWAFMVKKDLAYKRDETFLNRHPALQAKMRAILLDWLIEVCEVYRLHRDTYYLALDFIDRFLSSQSNVPKQQLQLIGITALFVAAKIEEIYPPKLSEFAYVTDGACTEGEILDKELVILKGLNWDLCPVTVYGWLNIFLQITNMDNIVDKSNTFVFPHYSAHNLLQISQVIDLCMLDVGCLHFSYSVIAASALYHTCSQELALSVSGYKWSDVTECVRWMAPFAITIRENGPVQPKCFKQIPEEDVHNIQTHDIDMQLLEKAQNLLGQVTSENRVTPISSVLLTPPQSEEKMPLIAIV